MTSYEDLESLCLYFGISVIIETVRSPVNPSFLRCYVPSLRYAMPG